MQTDSLSRSYGKCPVCGKEVILRDVRGQEPQYCSRICAQKARYNLRYKGTNAGPLDRPKRDKTKEL